jgi:hypothetical protein
MVLKLGHLQKYIRNTWNYPTDSIQHVEHSESLKSRMSGKFWNTVLEKDEENQLDWPCEKWSVTKSQRGQEYPTNNSRKEGRKANSIGHILFRYSLLKYVQGEIQGRREVMGRRCMQLLDDLRERRGHCKLIEEALDRTLWRTYFGRGYGPL